MAFASFKQQTMAKGKKKGERKCLNNRKNYCNEWEKSLINFRVEKACITFLKEIILSQDSKESAQQQWKLSSLCEQTSDWKLAKHCGIKH